MSDTDDHTTRSYRNPPAENRFRKGVSGNPKGQPRKKRAFVCTKVYGRPGIATEDRIKSLPIKEAYRLITIREGDRLTPTTSSSTTIQAKSGSMDQFWRNSI